MQVTTVHSYLKTVLFNSKRNFCYVLVVTVMTHSCYHVAVNKVTDVQNILLILNMYDTKIFILSNKRALKIRRIAANRFLISHLVPEL